MSSANSTVSIPAFLASLPLPLFFLVLDHFHLFPQVVTHTQNFPTPSSIQPLPTIPLPRRSLQCASLLAASFEAPLSCLRARPKHQDLRRSARAAESPSRYNRSAAHQSR